MSHQAGTHVLPQVYLPTRASDGPRLRGFPLPPLPKWETPERVSGPDTEVTLCLPFSLLFRQVIFPRRSRGGVAYRYYGKILFEVILVPLRDFLSAV